METFAHHITAQYRYEILNKQNIEDIKKNSTKTRLKFFAEENSLINQKRKINTTITFNCFRY